MKKTKEFWIQNLLKKAQKKLHVNSTSYDKSESEKKTNLNYVFATKIGNKNVQQRLFDQKNLKSE